MEYLEQDVNAFHREDWFLANIAREIRRTIQKEPGKEPKWEGFLLKFTNKGKVKKMTKEEATEKSKRRWLPWMGINRKK